MSRVIIDVREPGEYNRSHASGALNVPLSRLAAALPGISRDAQIILYCNSGQRAGVAAEMLKQLGYANVINGISQSHVAALYT